MITREYQLEELKKARELQEKCLGLHLPSPPVMHWRYNISDKNGEIIEKGIGKSNSFVRNAFNAMATYMGLCSKGVVLQDGYGDGVVNIKMANGSVYATQTRSVAQPIILVGTNNSPESLDSYGISLPSATYLAPGTPSSITDFDPDSRKLITVITRVFAAETNNTSPLYFTESGFQLTGPNGSFLMARDIFDAIPLNKMEVLTWEYVIETQF